MLFPNFMSICLLQKKLIFFITLKTSSLEKRGVFLCFYKWYWEILVTLLSIIIKEKHCLDRCRYSFFIKILNFSVEKVFSKWLETEETWKGDIKEVVSVCKVIVLKFLCWNFCFFSILLTWPKLNWHTFY